MDMPISSRVLRRWSSPTGPSTPRELCATAGLRVTSAEVGDPDPLSAIGDALEVMRVDEIVLFARGRHVAPAYRSAWLVSS